MIISEKPDKISSPMDVARIMEAIIAAEHETGREREHFWSIGLNTTNKIKYIELVSLGGLDRSYITLRETFRRAMMRACKKIIVCHNHPSGNTRPSMDDEQLIFRSYKIHLSSCYPQIAILAIYSTLQSVINILLTYKAEILIAHVLTSKGLIKIKRKKEK